jgi:UDP-N-acetylglucosamine acyltransferase
MPQDISPLAYVDPRAELGDDVQIGPFCHIGPDVVLGPGNRLISHVTIIGRTTIGHRNHFYPGAVIGGEPQDYSYSGGPTQTLIGDDNIFREGVTVNRGAEKEDHATRIGQHNFLMANCHVAHNCNVGDHVILCNGVLLGGHVHVQDHAIVSGNSVVHHFATIGTMAFVSGGCRVPQDVPPYMLAAGSDSPEIVTVNIVGMRRKGVSEESIRMVRQAYKRLYREHALLSELRQEVTSLCGESIPIELLRLLDFLDYQAKGKNGRGREQVRFTPSTDREAA